MVYGPGIHSFLKLNNRLVQIFAILAICALLQMIIFRSFSGLDSFQSLAATVNWSFGSMGFAQNLCSKAMLNWGSPGLELNFRCEGHTQISSVLSSGIVSYSSAEDYQGLTEVFAKCYYDAEMSDASYFPYMQYFNADVFNAELLTAC